MRNVLSLAAALVAVAGCAGTPSGEVGAPRPETRLLVDNQNWADVNVYALAGAERRRLGTVVTANTRGSCCRPRSSSVAASSDS